MSRLYTFQLIMHGHKHLRSSLSVPVSLHFLALCSKQLWNPRLPRRRCRPKSAASRPQLQAKKEEQYQIFSIRTSNPRLITFLNAESRSQNASSCFKRQQISITPKAHVTALPIDPINDVCILVFAALH